MKRSLFLLLLAGMLIVGFTASCVASEGVAIQKVITNTRQELGQLATSTKASEIGELMKKFDVQYETWSSSCGGGENFDPDAASDACKQMAAQMRETGIQLYSKLADYLPDVAVRYEQGARSANKIVERNAGDQTPADLYRATIEGISGMPKVDVLSPGDPGSPFDLTMDDFPDPTDKMFAVLEKLVPDFGKEIPEVVRAGNTQVNMMKKAHRARYLADQFGKARFVLESQREYGEIIFNTTKAVSAMPKVLGIQYTGAKLIAKPNQKVLDYYRSGASKKKAATTEKKIGGFDVRS